MLRKLMGIAWLVGAIACGGASTEAEEPEGEMTSETETTETQNPETSETGADCDGCYASGSECRRDLNAGMDAPDCGDPPCATPSVRTVACDPSCCP